LNLACKSSQISKIETKTLELSQFQLRSHKHQPVIQPTLFN
jgi:hypothetical protein